MRNILLKSGGTIPNNESVFVTVLYGFCENKYILNKSIISFIR